MNKILILVGGGISHLSRFEENAKLLLIPLVTASFSDIKFFSGKGEMDLFVKGEPLENFDVIYFRLVGRRFEDMALVADFAKKKGIKIVDEIYEKTLVARLPLSKSLETKLMVESGLPVPKTFYGTIRDIKTEVPKRLGFPFVIKGTIGKQGHAVWSPENEKELSKLADELASQERAGKRFIAQEFIKASQRERVLVIGNSAVGAITRPTRWRKRFASKAPERKAVTPIPKDEEILAIRAASSLGINVAGVDIIREDTTGNLYVLEVNSAPRWESIRQDTAVNVEAEILKYLGSLAK